MSSLSVLVFDLDGTRYGVDVARVRESVWLPELARVEEAPAWIAGVFSLRGRIVPVADLHLRFGHMARPYGVGDRVVVLEDDHLAMGVIVGDVIEVVELPPEAIQPPLRFDIEASRSGHLVAGEAQVGDELVILLDAARLVHQPDGLMLAEALEQPVATAQFQADVAPEARALFRARAVALRDAVLEEEDAPLGLAVIEMGGERFGFELAAVREFCDITQVNPIPCCPPHIRGVINLRGDLVTLIDPRAALGLPTTGAGGGKAVIGTLGERAVAIAVDEVHDVAYLRLEELQAPPPALQERHGAEIAGIAPYAGGMMTVLDLSALLAREEWVVDENVGFGDG